MKLYCWIIILFHLFSASVFALDEYESIAIEAKNHAAEQMAIYKQDAENAKIVEKSLSKLYQSDAHLFKNQEKEVLSKIDPSLEKNVSSRKQMPSILIFVSFSMPTQSLEAYLRDAKKIHASIVVRGLIDNSFQKTFKRIAELVKTSGGTGVELNPIWFKRFSIDQVPAVVIVPEGSECFKSDHCRKERDYDVMTGDITLSAALKMIRDRGQLTQSIAKDALATLRMFHA